MGFVAHEVVAPLAWDFTNYGGGKGVTPEPSTREIERFLRRSRALGDAVVRTARAAIDQESERLEQLTPEQAKQEIQRWAGMDLDQALEVLNRESDEDPNTQKSLDLVRKMAELIAETAHDCPDVDAIMALPGRIRWAFFGWFTKEMTDPELVAAGTKASLSLIRGE